LGAANGLPFLFKKGHQLKLLVLILISIMLAACNLVAAPPTPDFSPDPTLGAPTTDEVVGLETVGVSGLEPSGAGPCIVTAQTALPIHDSPGDDTPVIATLGENLSESAFLKNGSWYAISWYRGDQEIIGWVEEMFVNAAGECSTLPEV
jgi:hypothetical protein